MQSHDAPVIVPENDPNAPAASMDRCTSGQEQEQGRAKQQREHTRPTANTNRERRKRKNQQNTTRKKGQVATTGGGAGKAGEDRAEEAAHITLE